MWALLPPSAAVRPPIVLVHGAANSAAVWTFWQRELAARGWPSYALDLRGHGASGPADLSRTGMADYAADVAALAEQFARTPILLGWSMGGLVAMMVAASGLASACIALAPSLPARRIDPSVDLRREEFGPEEYGLIGCDPDDQPAMPDLDREERTVAIKSLSRESRLARDERRRGIVIGRLPCQLLLVTGTADSQWPRARYDDLWLGADHLSLEGASHWGLVLNRRALEHGIPRAIDWLDRAETSTG